ncbi:hypothetical protein MTR67_047588 [Solanum verrucosum]|uniref:Transposase n=1 Tax=Solanum verrucosum TaxID=315347 RepID=A0AAF0UW39_SOLVR|nr:hypothetical protein MTR67_047588 [Solanum verrucosum]
MFNSFKESRYNLVIGTIFERKTSARLSSWLKKVRDSGEHPGWMLPHIFDELGQYWNTDKFKAISDQAKKSRGSLKGGSLHTGGAKTVGAIAREMRFSRKKENEYDPDVWVEERAERTFNDFHQYVAKNLDSSVQLTPELSTQIWKEKVSGLEGIGSSRQAEALDGVQIPVMSDQIVKLTAALAESEQRRVVEQESMSEIVQHIKEQVMNLARRPTTSAPDDTEDESDEDDYVDLTP